MIFLLNVNDDIGDDHGEESVSTDEVEIFLYTALFLINNLSWIKILFHHFFNTTTQFYTFHFQVKQYSDTFTLFHYLLVITGYPLY